MKIVILFCVLLQYQQIVAYENLVKQYVQDINSFIESTEEYSYPTDSREYLKGQDEDIIKECSEVGDYDFIVVGAGSSGSVLASRLSEVRGWRVLLLEAGGQETRVSNIPAMFNYLRLSRFNWGYKSIPQNNSLLSYVNQTQIMVRGKSLGGSSAVNLMMYVRGNKEDYNLWESLGNPGWSYRDVLPYFKKSEHTHIHRPDSGYHGFNGELTSETAVNLSPLSFAFLSANQELGRRVVYDYNGRYEGFGRLQTNTIHGQRDSGARAFLTHASHRHNLKILTNTLVVKLLIENNTAYGIQFLNNGISYCVNATKEVILSAGVMNSPQLLMLAGIGAKEELEQHNITVVKDLPGVGNNMWDHIMNNYLSFTTNYTFSNISEEEAIYHYLHGKDYLTTPANIQDIGFVSLNTTDTSRPNIEHVFTASTVANTSYDFYYKAFGYSEEMYNSLIQPLIGQTTWSSLAMLLHPKSRGTVKLKSNSPFDFPIVNPNALSDPNNDDLNAMVAAVKDIIRISETEAMQKYNSQLFKIDIVACQNYTYKSDEYYVCLVKNLASSISHFSGTTKMGPKNDSQAVVDNELRVYGINNLRVVDCSVIPVTISGHTNAPAYMIGEKAADLLKKKYGQI